MNWKKKGKCNKGDDCPFIHGDKEDKPSTSTKEKKEKKIEAKAEIREPREGKGEGKGVGEGEGEGNSDNVKLRKCIEFKKKGKCRKGLECKFLHDGGGSAVSDSGKRKRVDGNFLVEKRVGVYSGVKTVFAED